MPRERPVDQHHLRRSTLGCPQQLLQQQRVRLREPDVGVTETGVELEREVMVCGTAESGAHDEVAQRLRPAAKVRLTVLVERLLRGGQVDRRVDVEAGAVG